MTHVDPKPISIWTVLHLYAYYKISVLHDTSAGSQEIKLASHFVSNCARFARRIVKRNQLAAAG